MVHIERFNSENLKLFFKFLVQINVNKEIINRFKKIPISIKFQDSEYDLDIVVKKYYEGKSSYEFELNYFSMDKCQYLFPCNFNNNLENTINFIEIRLKNLNLK